MARELHYTLLTDGPSDEALKPIINWLLTDIEPNLTLVPAFADLRGVPRPPSLLDGRIAMALSLFPCDILFVHRDAESQSPHARRAEIQVAVDRVTSVAKHIPVIPVKMTETWLLTDEQAIRNAARNPNGATLLSLPTTTHLEDLPDPKKTLRDLVSLAAEATTRHRRRERNLFTARTWIRIAEETKTFANLSQLPAFAELRKDVEAVLAT